MFAEQISLTHNTFPDDLCEYSARHPYPEEGGVGQNPQRDPSSSLLYRLVNLAARTLEAASPPQGHLARRYVPLLRGMADIVASHDPQIFSSLNNNNNNNNNNNPRGAGPSAAPERAAEGVGGGDSGVNIAETQMYNNLEEDIWGMWRQAGLEPINWPSFPDFLDLQSSVV